MTKMLEKIGFKKVGYWYGSNGDLKCKIECEDSYRSVNGLYCFVVDGEPEYIGIAKSSLQARMKIYAEKHTGYQIVRNRNKIIEAINAEKEPQVYFMSNSNLLHENEIPIDMSAGLISGLNDTLKPGWTINRG